VDSDLTLYNKKNVQVGSYTHWAESNPGQKKHVLIFDRDDNKVKYIKFGPARFPILRIGLQPVTPKCFSLGIQALL
jgi:hypothetical protein